MSGWKGILWTLGLVFVVNIASAYINAGGDMFSMGESGWQAIINAGVAAVLAFAINYFAPMIPRYGVGAQIDKAE